MTNPSQDQMFSDRLFLAKTRWLQVWAAQRFFFQGVTLCRDLQVHKSLVENTHYDLLGDEHFLNLRGKNLSHMKLFLTDRKNRMLTHAVASGNDNQSTFGNLNFTAIIRLDTIQANIPRQLSVRPQPLPDLKNSGILNSLN